jgi:hypothetical protein
VKVNVVLDSPSAPAEVVVLGPLGCVTQFTVLPGTKPLLNPHVKVTGDPGVVSVTDEVPPLGPGG